MKAVCPSRAGASSGTDASTAMAGQRCTGDGTTLLVVDTTLLSRYYERFADHAVSVAHRVVYLATGVWPDELDPQDLAELDQG